MRRGLIISLALHLLILVSAVAVFPFSGDRLPAKPTPLPVDLVTQAELTKIKAGQRKAKAEAARAQKKPQPVKKKVLKKPKPKKVKVVKAPAPKPKPKPKKAVAKKKAKPKPKKVVAKKKAKPEKVAARPKPKPKPVVRKQKDFDPDNIAALLNKAPDAGGASPAAAEAKALLEPAKGRVKGRDAAMTYNEIDALRAKISQCWNPPVGGLGADAIKVKLRLRLREDGVLSRQPEVVNREGSPFFVAAADAAVRAVMLCQPYELPTRKYALWRDMILNFDPREMFGG